MHICAVTIFTTTAQQAAPMKKEPPAAKLDKIMRPRKVRE